MSVKKKLTFVLAIGVTVLVYIQLHFSASTKEFPLFIDEASRGFKSVAQDFLIPRAVDGGFIQTSSKTTTVQPCQGISNRWSIMYNPSLFSGKSRFPLVNPYIEPKLSCEDRHLDIIVTVNSGTDSTKHRGLRQAIRQTWANSSLMLNRSESGRWRLFFALGLTNKDIDDNLNEQEAEKNNDIIIGNFTDTYKNIPIKTFMSHLWAFSKFDFKYILKTDDDVYVRIPVLYQWLVNQGTPSRFYGGYINRNPVVFRNPGSKWYISFEQFNEERWPDFCHGAFQILSIDLLPSYLYYTQVHKPFHTDDAYMGVMARDFGVPVKDIPGFSTGGIPKNDCALWTAISIGHDVSPESMHKLYKTYGRLDSLKKSPCK